MAALPMGVQPIFDLIIYLANVKNVQDYQSKPIPVKQTSLDDPVLVGVALGEIAGPQSI